MEAPRKIYDEERNSVSQRIWSCEDNPQTQFLKPLVRPISRLTCGIHFHQEICPKVTGKVGVR